MSLTPGWIADASDESGEYRVYVRSYPTVGGKRQISAAGGMHPAWRRDGKELFYIAADDWLTAVDVATDVPVAQVGTPRQLFRTVASSAAGGVTDRFAASPDGQRFVVRVVGENDPNSLKVVLNWTAGLKK